MSGFYFYIWKVNPLILFGVSGVEGMAQMLEGFSGSLLLSLKEVLVERNKLTLGKELGKGQFMIPPQSNSH